MTVDVWWWTWGPDSPQSLIVWGGVARPSKLTADRIQAICEAVTAGATYEHAAAAVGISYSTLNEWRNTKPQFSEALKSAEAAGIVVRLKRIAEAAKAGAWQADAWLLERRHPDVYGKQIVQHEGGQTLTVRYENDWRAPTIDTEAQ